MHFALPFCFFLGFPDVLPPSPHDKQAAWWCQPLAWCGQTLHQRVKSIGCQPHVSSSLSFLHCRDVWQAIGNPAPCPYSGESCKFNPWSPENNRGNPVVKKKSSFVQCGFFCVSKSAIPAKQHQEGEWCVLPSLVLSYSLALYADKWEIHILGTGLQIYCFCFCWELSLVASVLDVSLQFWFSPPWMDHSSFGGCLSIFLVGIW